MDGQGRRLKISVRPPVILALLLVTAAEVAQWAPPVASASAKAISAPTGPVKTAGTVLLSGSVHPMAIPELETRRVDPRMQLSGMSLLFRMSPSQQALQKDALASVQEPTSRTYHRWLTPEQYAVEFGASRDDVERATEWLTSQGLTVEGPSRTATRLAFSGTVAQIEHAFQTEMHHYRVGGETHFAMSRAPSVPADLADRILGLHGLHDFRMKAAPPQGVRPLYALPITGPDGGPAYYPVLAPADFAKIYDVNGLYAAHITGSGESIAVIGRSDFNDADIAAFRSTFGLSASPPVRVLVPNSGAAVVSGDFQEDELDLEWVGAVAYDASIKHVFIGNAANNDIFDALNYAIEQRAASVVSLSYGKCEGEFAPADVALVERDSEMAALEGMTVVVASGDTGAAACDDNQSALQALRGKAVLFPASVPSFVAVGGSQFQITAANQSTYLDAQLDALSYIPESGWNETLFDIDAGYGGLGASGGGASHEFAKPYWQVPYTPTDGARDLPDVALSASADILPYAVSMSWTIADGDAQAPQPQALTAFGGTSVATPAFAGILALVNQAIAVASPGAPAGLGNANPVLYALANSGAFHDITTGDNIVPCQPGSPDCPASPPYQFGYTAGPGYDQVTGLGSVDAARLVAAWTALTPTSTTLQVTSSGPSDAGSLQLSAIVASNATANQMTGSVTFYILAPGDGGIDASPSLGAMSITAATSSGTEQGTASLTASAPVGLDGTELKFGAFYGGDRHYAASWSALVSATVSDGGDDDSSTDASSVDAMPDAQQAGAGHAGPSSSNTTGCGCATAGAQGHNFWGFALLGVALACACRRRSAPMPKELNRHRQSTQRNSKHSWRQQTRSKDRCPGTRTMCNPS